MKIYLYNDVAFRWVFGRQEQVGPIASVLNAVVGYDCTEPGFRDIRILNPFDLKKYKADKQGILDLRVRDETTDTWLNVEMQVKYQAFYPERSMFYLAGMYRDQLKAGKVYQDLRPCYGVHIVMADMLEQETDWYNHYRMLNVKSHKPLSRHWEMYFVELDKFKKALKKGSVSQNILWQWCDYLAKPHDSSEKLDKSFQDNEGIQEVHEMLREFTEDERLREQYRLHEEWLRDQRSSERAMREALEALEKEKQMRKKAESERKKAEKKAEAERKKAEKKAEAERKKAEKKAEAERKKIEAELKEKERRSILALRKVGESDKSIAELLGMSENEVKKITDV